VLARPATTREQRRLPMAARRLRAGISPHRLGRFADFFVTYRKPKPPTHDPTISPDVRDVMAKSSQPLFRCLLRVAVTADSSAAARGRIHGILGGFAAYEGRVGRRGVRRARAKLEDRALGRRAFLASTGELAALAHLPGVEAIPGVVMAGAREVAPPPGLPRDGKPLGLSAAGKPVNISVADARRHMHLLGPVLLRSRVPGTAGNSREQPTTSPSVFAGFPACSRLFSDYERIGETGPKTPERSRLAARRRRAATGMLPAEPPRSDAPLT
jgi:hypothetical protein